MSAKSFQIQTTKPWPLTLGLDISGKSLKYVLIRRLAGSFKVESFGRSVFDHDEDAIDQTRIIIQQLIHKNPAIKKAKIIMGADGARVVVKNESFPPLAKNELKQTIAFSVIQEMGNLGAGAECIADFVPLGPDDKQPGNTQYLCMGIAEEFANEKMAVFEGLNVFPAKIIPSVAVMANLTKLLPVENQKKCVGFLDIGAERSMLVLIKQGRIVFFREIVVGGDDFKKAVTGTIFHEGRAIQFGEEEAAEFIHKFGYPVGFSQDMTFRGAPLGEVGTMVRPVVERLVGEIKRSVDFFKDKSPGEEISEVKLIGGGARTKHLADLLSEKTELSISPMSYSKSVKIAGDKKQTEAFKNHYLELLPALALAMEVSAQGNLLPHDIQKMHKRYGLYQGILAGTLGAAALVALLSFQMNDQLKNSEADVARLRRQLSQDTGDTRFQYTALQNKVSALKSEESRLNQYISQDKTPVYLLRLISNFTPEKTYILSYEYGTGAQLDIASAQARPRRGAPQQAETDDLSARYIIRINGQSQEPPNDIGVMLAQFMIDLELSGFFNSVRLEREEYDEDENIYRFIILGVLGEGARHE